MADSDGKDKDGISRRSLLGATTIAATIPGLGLKAAGAQDDAADQDAGQAPSQAAAAAAPYNVILIITDEEAYHLRPTEGYALPARDELKRRGTTFENHYIGAAMCTPSRGVMFSGQPPQVNGVYDQMEAGYVPSLPRDKPSIGTVFKQLGYETAYFGKFELKRSIITASDSINYSTALEDYGFDQFAPDGDKVGAPNQGYETDRFTAAEAVRWLRTNGQAINEAGKPWLLVVSFVSPHDIMYGEVNQPGTETQVSQVGMTINPPPDERSFQTEWSFPPSPSHDQPLDTPGRPRAQLSYMIGWSAFLGEIPVGATEMWNDYYNYYLNLIRENDHTLQRIVNAIGDLGLWDNTVVFRTADHGELGGSHGGLRGKGPLPYEQEVHVPAVIVHPEHEGGRQCHALTSHIDLLPTLVGLTGISSSQTEPLLEGLPGRDASILLQSPEDQPVSALREAILFNYVGLQTIDALYMMRVCRAIAQGEWAPPFSVDKPDLTRRGFVSCVYDGRHKYARYFSPLLLQRPTSFDDLMQNFEIELFDLQNDPDEVVNLGADPANRELIMTMNQLLNTMLGREVGEAQLSFLPSSLFET